MDKDTIKRNWGERFSIFFRKTKNKKYLLKQKDLATTLDISEDTITQWKQGKLDIKLTSIYGVVNYIKSKYPDANVMSLLFPDLIGNEIITEVKNKIEAYTKVKNENKKLKNENERLYNKLSRYKSKYDMYYNALMDLHKVCCNLPENIKRYYFEGKISTPLFLKMFYQ